MFLTGLVMKENSERDFYVKVAMDLMKRGEPEQTGLHNGNMAYALFFYWLSGETGVKEYEAYADKMVELTYDGVYAKSFDLERDLPGVVCGIEFLVQSGYCSGNTDEILEDDDAKIRQLLFDRRLSLSELSATGLCFYARCMAIRSCQADVVERRLRRAVLQYLEMLDLLLKKRVDYAAGLTEFNVNHPLFLCLGSLIGLYRFDLFNSRVGRFVGLLSEMFEQCHEVMDWDNKVYLVYLLKNFQKYRYVKPEVVDAVGRLIVVLEVSHVGHPLFGCEPQCRMTAYKNRLFFGMSGMSFQVLDI